MALEERVNKEMKISKQIMIQAYLTADNKPTCCQDHKEGYCFMLRSTRLNTEYQCALQAGSREYLERFFDETKAEHGEYTYLIPHENCPVWKV